MRAERHLYSLSNQWLPIKSMEMINGKTAICIFNCALLLHGFTLSTVFTITALLTHKRLSIFYICFTMQVFHILARCISKKESECNTVFG